MGSKRRISYHWRLFVPMVLSLWVIILGMAWWQVYRVEQVRRDMVFDQLKVVGARVADLCSKKISPTQYLQYVDEYYKVSPDYDEIVVDVYDRASGKILAHTGPAVDLSNHELDRDMGTISLQHNEINPDKPTKYLYYTLLTADGKSRIIVLMPYTKKVAVFVTRQTTRFWMIFIAIGLFATCMAYVATSYIGRNIRILREFAQRISTDTNAVIPDESSFPHDELGDISRTIVEIYRQRMNEMARREKEHRVAIYAIDEKTRNKRELIGNINHELKTPIGIIKGYLDTLNSDPDMDPALRKKFIAKACDNVDRLIALITDITTITKLESGDKLVNLVDVNFHDLVFTLASDLEQTNFFEGKIAFHFELPLNCIVLANEALLTGVLMNLCRNSLLYSQGTECVLEMVDEDDKFYYFEFYDNGVGISPEHFPHIFDRFYRVNTGRSRISGGTGLGLAIVSVTIESFGGNIEVFNRQPTGLAFRFSIPKFKSAAR